MEDAPEIKKTKKIKKTQRKIKKSAPLNTKYSHGRFSSAEDAPEIKKTKKTKKNQRKIKKSAP